MIKYKYLKKVYYHLPMNVQSYLTKFIFKPRFGEDVYFGHGYKNYYGKVEFGRGVRVAGSSIYANIIVGNYTMFAEGFRCLWFVHDYNAFSINSGLTDMLSLEMVQQDQEGSPQIRNYPQSVIGSDVWIGEFVTIKGGIHIGDGAVIAARSVVTHDVPAYAVVGGIPARLIKWRFDSDTIDFFEKIRWWDWPKERIEQEYDRLCKFDRTLLGENGNRS